jgi:hypothetical protein
MSPPQFDSHFNGEAYRYGAAQEPTYLLHLWDLYKAPRFRMPSPTSCQPCVTNLLTETYSIRF